MWLQTWPHLLLMTSGQLPAPTPRAVEALRDRWRVEVEAKREDSVRTAGPALNC